MSWNSIQLVPSSNIRSISERLMAKGANIMYFNVSEAHSLYHYYLALVYVTLDAV